VDDQNSAMLVDINCSRAPEALLWRTVGHDLPTLSEVEIGCQELGTPLGHLRVADQRRVRKALWIEDRHAVVAPVRDINDALVIHGHASGPLELAMVRAR